MCDDKMILMCLRVYFLHEKFRINEIFSSLSVNLEQCGEYILVS